jgi:hypothetical protein
MGEGKLTGPKTVSRRRGLRVALLLAGVVSLLLPASALAAPETTIDRGPADGSSIPDDTAAFEFSANELLATFQCRFDSNVEADFQSCSSPRTYDSLADGTHTFEVRAVSLLTGTGTPATRTFTVDTVPPDTTIDPGGPTGLTGDDTPTFSFSSTGGSTFECRVDSGTFAACASPHTTPSLPDGAHTFQVRAVDAAGNSDPTPASRSFTVDTQGPDTTIDSGPPDPTDDDTPSFDFSSDDGSTFECRVDLGSFAPCSRPLTVASLADGAHTFEVRALDAVGNPDPTPASRSFTVDTTDPVTKIDSGPVGITPENMPTFSFSAQDATATTFECRIDGAPYGPCSGPGDAHTPGIPLDDGPHTFEVRATDAAGNRDQSPPTRIFAVDTVPPNTTIGDGPTGTTDDATPTFTFSTDNGSRFECSVDGAAFGACSGPGDAHTTGPLADGDHSFAVRAVDAAANVDPTPAVRSFTVDTSGPPDTTGPDTTITKRPRAMIKTKRKKARVKVAFSSEAGASFDCKLDQGKYTPCSSPYVVKAKGKSGKGRKHTISVRATDGVGNPGDPELVSFMVRHIPRLQASRAERTVVTALKRHGYARRVVKALRTNCHRKSRTTFGCKFSSRFRGYRLKGSGEVKLRADLSYRFRVKAQGVRFTLTDKNEKG